MTSKPTIKDYRRFITEYRDWLKYNATHVSNKYRRCYVIARKQFDSDIINILQEEPNNYKILKK